MNLEGKIALVTGCKQGIGYGIALSLAENGADVILNDINISEQDEIYKEISKLQKKALCVSGDISKEEQVDLIFQKVKSEFGKLDILVNNAGITRDAMSTKMTMEQWNQVLAVNLTGTFLCAKSAVNLMEAVGGGSIINFSSINGFKGNIGQANYASTKAAIVGLTRTLALEYAKKNIRVNAIAPGFIDTPMTQVIPEHLKQDAISKIPIKEKGYAKRIANSV
jgi:NAD(P)-dependent dehydrogenase (short-subunit alcohol dehydrogenase family)